ATVNRELSLLRRVLNVAVENGWLVKNPFKAGKPLINMSDEKERERVLTREEEERILSLCVDQRAHLRPIIICALDTGMRRGEVFKLKWSDVDFDNRLITMRQLNTKTQRERQVSMTERLYSELMALYETSSKEPEDLVFGIRTSVKTAFNKIKKEVA